MFIRVDTRREDGMLINARHILLIDTNVVTNKHGAVVEAPVLHLNDGDSVPVYNLTMDDLAELLTAAQQPAVVVDRQAEQYLAGRLQHCEKIIKRMAEALRTGDSSHGAFTRILTDGAVDLLTGDVKWN